jgi:hypothetical protein
MSTNEATTTIRQIALSRAKAEAQEALAHYVDGFYHILYADHDGSVFWYEHHDSNDCLMGQDGKRLLRVATVGNSWGGDEVRGVEVEFKHLAPGYFNDEDAEFTPLGFERWHQWVCKDRPFEYRDGEFVYLMLPHEPGYAPHKAVPQV